MSTLTITTIQSALHWENCEANLQMFDKKIRNISGKTELVILPEMFTTGFSMNPYSFAETMDGRTVTWMKNLAAEKNVIITGSVIIAEELPADGGRAFYNRLIWTLPNGQLGHYDKRHLFAYAGEHEHYRSGGRRLVASVNGWRVHLLICYDLRFPVWSRQTTPLLGQTDDRAEYDLIIYVANWPERRQHAWRTLLQARAIENQSYVVGVNRVGHDGNQVYYAGDSMIVDPVGDVLYSKLNDEDVFTTTLDREHLNETRRRLPFLADADRFTIHG